MKIQYCKAFSMESPADAFKHLFGNYSIVKRYGSYANGHDLFVFDEGGRNLAKCNTCNAYFLIQKSEFHGFDDSYYSDYFPVSGEDEAEWLNGKYNGWEIEEKFNNKYLQMTNLRVEWSSDNSFEPREHLEYLNVKEERLAKKDITPAPVPKHNLDFVECINRYSLNHDFKYFDVSSELTAIYVSSDDFHCEGKKTDILWLKPKENSSFEKLLNEIVEWKNNIEEEREFLNNNTDAYSPKNVYKVLAYGYIGIESDSKPDLTEEEIALCDTNKIGFFRHVDSCKPVDDEYVWITKNRFYDYLYDVIRVKTERHEISFYDYGHTCYVSWEIEEQ